jgi:hypothetical protein
MASAKDLFSKLGNSGGGFKVAPKSVIPNAADSKADAKAAVGGHKATEALKEHGPKKGGGAGGGGGTVPIGVRPKV